jgi:hypothetical protein
MAATLLTACPALAQLPGYLPGSNDQSPGMARVTVGMPALLSASPDSAPPTNDGALTGGSTGLRPGVDCLPAPCDVCRAAPRFYGDVAYMLTWIKDGPRNFPLAATTPPAAVGFGVVPGTTFFGGDKIDFDAFNGMRGTAGVWLDRQARWGVEGVGFFTEQRSDGFLLTNTGAATNPVALVRPVIDPGINQVVTAAVAVPSITAGSVTVDSTSRLWGAEGNIVRNYRNPGPTRIDLLAGFRYLDLRETLSVAQSSTTLANPVAFAPPLSSTSADEFDTRNQFFGGQVGSRMVLTRGPLALTLISKLALGFTYEVVDRTGISSYAIPGFPSATPGGFLVQASNAGREYRDRFAVLPETTVQLDYWITEHLSAFIGYNFLYVSSVARPGDQVDPAVELVVTPIGGLTVPGTSPGATRPAAGIHGDSFYANSLTFGMAYKW